jgi:hypothetical protein
VLALMAAAVWWLGVIRDHHKDDLRYLQANIQLVQKLKDVVCDLVAQLRAMTAQLGPPPLAGVGLESSNTTSGQTGGRPASAVPALNLFVLLENASSPLKQATDLLDGLLERERRLCDRSFLLGLPSGT